MIEDNLHAKFIIRAYQSGKVVENKKVEKSYFNLKSFTDLACTKRNFAFILSSSSVRISSVFSKEEETIIEKTESKKIEVLDIPEQANAPRH